MALSKKLLIGIGASLATTAAVIGTAVEVTTSQNSVTSNSFENEMSESAMGSVSNSLNTQPTPAPTNEMISLEQLVEKITKSSVVINQIGEDGKVKPNTPIENSESIYAFDIKNKQLALKDVNLPDGISSTIVFASSNNTAANLNNGKLDVTVTLTKEQESANKTITLDGFKTAKRTEFASLLMGENNSFVLNIQPQMDEEMLAKYVDLNYLNNIQTKQFTLLANSNRNNPIQPDALALMEETDDQEEQEGGQIVEIKETGLTFWLREDSTKKEASTGIKLEGQVKLSKISKQTLSNKETAVFHLVAKDQNSRIKLVKTDGTNNNELVLDEIKTTNLLASDIAVFSSTLDANRQAEYLTALKAIGSEVETEDKYIIDKVDSSLNRNLAIDLGESSSHNYVFVKPYSIKKPNENNYMLDISIVVTFGEKDYATSFDTSKQDQLETLKNAGFSFGIYSLNLNKADETLKATDITAKKTDLAKYFKVSNYLNPVDRPKEEGDIDPKTYPGGFNLSEIKNENLTTSLLKLNLGNQMENAMSQNWLVFADYSYAGINMNKVLFTPVISLIHLEGQTMIH